MSRRCIKCGAVDPVDDGECKEFGHDLRAYDRAKHVNAECPQCPVGAGCGTPASAVTGDGDPRDASDVRTMICVACGFQWTEMNERQIARAWYGWGAYVGEQTR